MSTTQAIVLSLLTEAVAEGACLAFYGAGAEGAAVGARVTARVSAVIFSLALALRTRPALGPRLLYGFVAAHSLHYVAVVYLASVAVHHHLHHVGLRSVGVVTFGVLLLAAIAATTGAAGGGRRWLNAVAVSVAWLIFLGGALLNGPNHRAAFIPLAPLLAGLGYHLYSVAAQRRSALAQPAS